MATAAPFEGMQRANGAAAGRGLCGEAAAKRHGARIARHRPTAPFGSGAIATARMAHKARGGSLSGEGVRGEAPASSHCGGTPVWAEGRNGRQRIVGAKAASDSEGLVRPSWFNTYLKASNIFANMFPLWTLIAALVAVRHPTLFSWLSTQYFTLGLAILMFSMGITLSLDDFKRVMTKPGPVTMNFLCCYVMMPLLGLTIGKLFQLSTPLIAGLVLVGSINGGQASNLCTYIARGDVALSVVMTTSTTLGTIVMTPLLAKLLLGAIVPVDAIGVAISSLQVVLVPIVLGVALNTAAPKFCRTVEPACPVVGVLSTVLLVGASVAGCSEAIISAGIVLQLPVILLHLIGGAAGYWVCRLCKFSEVVCRTTAIETAMKSSAFGVLLATLHFGEYLVRVPAAVSVVWMALMGSSMAVIWQMIPVKDA